MMEDENMDKVIAIFLITLGITLAGLYLTANPIFRYLLIITAIEGVYSDYFVINYFIKYFKNKKEVK